MPTVPSGGAGLPSGIGDPIRGGPAKGVVAQQPGQLGHGRLHNRGLVVRFSPVRGVTPKAVLDTKIWLPVVLNNVTLTEGALHNEYDTLSAGQFSQPAMGRPDVQTQLTEFPLDTLTVSWEPVWYVVTNQNPLRLRNALGRIMRSRKPVHMLLHIGMHDPFPEVDMKVTLRQRTREIRAGEHDTHYMTLQIKEWRDNRIPVDSSRPSGGNSGRKKGVTLPTRHRLKRGDTLLSLSFEYYGDYSHARFIRKANDIPLRWGVNTPLVGLGGKFKVGYKLLIPAPASGGGGLR